jgi:prolyl oligopeptidase
MTKTLSYPNTPAVDQVDNYHGTSVPDPYRWLEEVDSQETLAWVQAQNRLTFGFLEKLPQRERLRGRLTELWDYPKASAPRKQGGRYFQFMNTGLQNQDVLYTFENLGDGPRLLLDPNTFSNDGTVALNGWSPSEDGNLIAYATSSSGSDWLSWRVRDVHTGEDLPDRIEWSKFSGASWLPDGSGFYYSRYDQPEESQAYTGVNLNQKVYFHLLGTAQEEDRLVYERPDQPEWGFDAEVTHDGRYLILHIWQGTDVRNRVFYRDLAAGGEFVELIDRLEADFTFIENDGPRFYFRTGLDAPRRRLIAMDIQAPQRKAWQTIIPESEATLEAVQMVNGEFIAVYLEDAHHSLRRFDRQGNPLGEIKIPLGSILSSTGFLSLTGRREHDELFFLFHSFVHPPSVFRFDFKTDELAAIWTPDIQFNFTPYETEQVFVASKDGARIPMFLVHKGAMPLDGDNPTLLFGYGGFNVPVLPVFSISRLAWLELGGVLAVACLRGGGEYGEEWHRAGMQHHKQNVFDDFIACAEWLVAQGITCTPRLAIQGRSNGGLLVGACLTQRPDLFGAALPAVGVMDMLRFHKFTIGWAWVSDYGSSDNPDDFQTLYAYSPLHNLHPGECYPPTLITTADHDDRVVPGHSFKFAAALQAAQGCENPVLIRIQTKAGHGFGKPTKLLIEEEADVWAFLMEALGIKDRTPAI